MSDPSPGVDGGAELQAEAGAEASRPVDWAAVRWAYEGTGLPTARLLEQFGISRGQLRWRQKRERWRIRPAVQEREALSRLGNAAPTRLRARMLRLLDAALADLELQVARQGRGPDTERALTRLAGIFGDLADWTGQGDGMTNEWRATGENGARANGGRGGVEPSGAARTKKKNNEPGCRTGDAESLERDRLDRLRAEVKGRLARLRRAEGIGEPDPGRIDG